MTGTDELTDETGSAIPVTPAREAIVYVPGLQLGLSDQRTFLGIAQRFARACDRNALERSATWSFESHPAELGPDHTEAQKTTVFMHQVGATTAVIDLYEFPWAREMTARWEAQGVRARALRGIVGFWYGFRLLVLLIVAKGEERTNRRIGQTAIALVFLLIVFVYVLGVLTAALTVVVGANDGIPRLIQQISVVFTAIVTFLFPALSARTPTLGASLLAASDYVRLPSEAQRIAGELTSLVEAIAESERHERIHVVAYSMGGIIAFDTLFPSTASPAASLDSVKSLVTIGTPYSTVRATRGTYFDRRKSGDPPSKWINYWAPADLLSSERPTLKDRTPFDAGNNRLTSVPYDLPVDLRLPNMLVLYGFSSHALYWGADGEQDNNIFDLVVGQLDLPYLRSAATVEGNRP